MPPRRRRRTGEGPRQPRCHCPSHHNTFIFSGLTGFQTGRYSQCRGPDPAQCSTHQQSCWSPSSSSIAVVVAAGHHAGPLPPLPRPAHPRAPRLADAALLRLQPRPGPDGGRRRRACSSATTALDITLEGAFLAGLVTGPVGAARWSARCSGTPALIAREWAALPFAVGCGFAAGGLREACPKEAIWRFSPFVARRAAPLRLADVPALRRSTGRSC